MPRREGRNFFRILRDEQPSPTVKRLGRSAGYSLEMASCTSCLRYSCSVSIAALLIMYFLPFLSIFKKPLHLMTHYEVLGIDAAATRSEIMKAFRQQSLIHHPDKQGSGNAKASQGGSNDYFIALVNAKEVLLDEEKRRSYDEELERKRQERFQRRHRQTVPDNVQGGTTIWAFLSKKYEDFLRKYVESDTTVFFLYNAIAQLLTIRGFLNFCFVLAIATVIIQFFLPLLMALLNHILCTVPYNCLCERQNREKKKNLQQNMREIREQQQRRHDLLASSALKRRRKGH